MKSLATILVLLSSFFLHGCSVRQAWGIKPDDVSQFQIGSSREQVEKLLDAPIEVSKCPRGTRAKYVYDRGQPAVKHPVVASTMAGFLTVLTGGGAEPFASCAYTCQRGILEIIFDHNYTVVLLRPHPYAYDVGRLCDTGADWRRFCKSVRSAASKTDLARLIQGPDDLLIETGCFTDFSGICPLAHDKRPTAQFHLGTLYRDGKLPVSKSRVKAYTWFSLAMQGGMPGAADARDEVAAKMSEDEIVKAERLVSEWQPNRTECGTDEALLAD